MYNIHDHNHYHAIGDLPWRKKHGPCSSWSLSLLLYDKWLSLEKQTTYNIHDHFHHDHDHYHCMTNDLPWHQVHQFLPPVQADPEATQSTPVHTTTHIRRNTQCCTKWFHTSTQHHTTSWATHNIAPNGPTPVQNTTHDIRKDTQHCTKRSHTSTQHHTPHQDKHTAFFFLFFLRTGQAK